MQHSLPTRRSSYLEGAENFAAQLGARVQHVETALAALAAQRTEGMGEIALLGLAIADRDEDDVALVALDILQILDEEGLSAPAQKIFLDVRVLATQQLELFQDQIGRAHV